MDTRCESVLVESTSTSATAISRRVFTFLCAAAIWLIQPGGARAQLTIPVSCGGTHVGDITAKIINPAAVDPAVRSVGVHADFSSVVGMPPSLTAAANACGEHHFNWYQVVIVDNFPPTGADGRKLTPPYVDPAPGGYSADPTQVPPFPKLIADNLPWFWNEGPNPAPGSPEGEAKHINEHTQINNLEFEDQPNGPQGQSLAFITWLVSLNKDGSLHSFHEGFAWQWVRSPITGNRMVLSLQPVTIPPLAGDYENIIGKFATRIEEKVNDQLTFRMDLSKGFFTYHPSCHYGPGAPPTKCGDDYPIDAVFEKKPGVNLSHLFFKVVRLDGSSCPCTVKNADDGPGTVGARISVPAAALGPDGILSPGEIFTQHFDITLTRHPESFTFFVDVFGSDP
jgi:hypothetical protein